MKSYSKLLATFYALDRFDIHDVQFMRYDKRTFAPGVRNRYVAAASAEKYWNYLIE